MPPGKELRMKTLLFALAGAALALPASADPQLRADALKLFGAIESPKATAIATPEAQLGRALFWDTRISLDGKTACASCHLDHGADRRKASIDAKGLATSRHSPTVFNSHTQPGLRWLSDRKTAADQAEGSLTGSMGFATKQAGVDKMKELQYADAFRAAYPNDAEPLNAKNYGLAIQAYDATLGTPAPFDRFLAGDDGALTDQQKQGLKTFVSTGCVACHSGPLFGGTLIMKLGITKDYWLETGSQKPDLGRFA